ncbi:hypothetical protein [Chitinophaga ginsengisegetis]|uniref:hypothetical protein n=1 Tax=Chitinophaga ginsengisegetis TaxID=393003 RepID=UPI000DB95DAE|nr:hypothetical protein [Chitinophaga ginsengisegetis]MDR6571319.1 YD repeat-containing protein [Chitinophaga ginsengisegetis]MDR6651053.1 YD repeat-containing protein [Chitinophaga ginsengisegetis]MDR6657403.1 YD repeat-containing protein [Chitinophaga ginsengisegetis]
MKSSLIILLVLVGIISRVEHLSAQNSSNAYFIPTVFPKSPNVAAMDKYGDYPVNQFSGLPDISIPLYEIVSGDFKMPVTLSYHASGFKVNEKAGWAGLGWSVITGGQVTRRIMGTPDEFTNGYLSGKLQPAATVNTESTASLQYLSNLKSKAYDAQPDIYAYSFNGRNGKFFFNGNDSYKIAMLPFSPLAISTNLSGLPYFDILDEQGNKYSFGKTAKEYNGVSTSGGTLPAASAWLLESMISQDNRDTISFSYNESDRVDIPDATEIWTVEDNVHNYEPSNPVYYANPQAITGSDNTSSISQRQLKEINFTGGKVVFELSGTLREDPAAGKYALNAIKVYTYDYVTAQFKLIKTVQFYKSYFIQGSDATTKRLRLDSLAILGGSGELLQKYRFDYNTSKILPQYTSTSRDFWGYYNGKPNSSLIPRMSVPYNLTTITIGSDVPDGRDPDNDYMQACILKKINYPTGGYTEFEYEANRYEEMGVVKLAGGLRIKAIKSAAGGKAKPVVKTYEYLNARPNFTLRNHFFKINQTQRSFWTNPHFACPVTMGTKNVTSYISSPTIDIEPYDAVPVAYTFVREYVGDGINNSGKTEYTFSDRPDALQTASLTGIPILNSYFYLRGQLLNKTQYLRSGTNYRKVQEDTYQYTAFPETSYNSVGFVVGKIIISDESSSSDVSLAARTGFCAEYHDSYSYNYSFYSISSDDNYLTAASSTSYDSDDQTKSVTITKQYKYDNFKHQQVSRTITTDSKGNTITTNDRYPADLLSGTATTTGNAVVDTMLRRNMHAASMEQWISISGTEGLSGTFVKGARLTNYKLLTNKAVKIDKQQELLVGSLISNFTPVYVNAGTLTTDSRYNQLISMDAYDASSNLLQYTARNSPSVAVLWDYNRKNAIAQVNNAAISDVAYTSFEADGKGNWTFAGIPVNSTTAITGKKVYDLTKGAITAAGLGNANAYIVGYWSRSGAATVNSTTASAGMSTGGWTYYEHRIPAGATTIQVSGAATIDELRLFPEKAQMTTYTYDPLIGVTSICSPLNIISYYEYDSAGRLKAEKDVNRNIVKTYDYHHKN